MRVGRTGFAGEILFAVLDNGYRETAILVRGDVSESLMKKTREIAEAFHLAIMAPQVWVIKEDIVFHTFFFALSRRK